MKWPFTWEETLIAVAMVAAVVCVLGLAWITAPVRPVASVTEKYLCATYTDEHIITTEYQLSQPGQMLFGYFLETKDRVVVNRADIAVCGLTRQ